MIVDFFSILTNVRILVVSQNLAYFAVQEILDILTPKFVKWDQFTVQNWIKKLHKVGNNIETVLSFKTEPNSEAEELKITNRFTYKQCLPLYHKLKCLCVGTTGKECLSSECLQSTSV